MAFGAIASGYYGSQAKLKCIFISNIIIIIACAFIFYSTSMNIYDDKGGMAFIIGLGKFIYGMAIGSFSLVCPKYIAETAPVELRNTVGYFT